MATTFQIDQIQTNQIIGGYPLVVTTTLMPGAELNNGSIDDQGFITGSLGLDVLMIFSGSKNKISVPISDQQTGIALFMGDVVISGSSMINSEIFSTQGFGENRAYNSFFVGTNVSFNHDGSSVANFAGLENQTVWLSPGVEYTLAAGNLSVALEDVKYSTILNTWTDGNPDPCILNITGAIRTLAANNGTLVASGVTNSILFGNDGTIVINAINSYINTTPESTINEVTFSNLSMCDDLTVYNSSYLNINTSFSTNITSSGAVESMFDENLTVIDSNLVSSIGNFGVLVSGSTGVLADLNSDINALNCNAGTSDVQAVVLFGSNHINISASYGIFALNNTTTNFLSASKVFSVLDSTGSFTNSHHIFSAENKNVIFRNAGGDNHGAFAIGSRFGSIRDCTNSFALGTYNFDISKNSSGVIGGYNNTIASSAINSLTLMSENNTILLPNRIIVGGPNHRTWISGSLNSAQISGSHHYLLNGTTPAYSTYTSASGPILIQTASSGQVQFGNVTRIPMAHYGVSTATASSPQIMGSAILNPYEHEDVDNISGSYCKFRVVSSVLGSGNGVFVKLWDATNLHYVEIGGPGITWVNHGNTTPTPQASVMLTGTIPMFSHSRAGGSVVYEVHAYYSGVNVPLGFQIHSAELIFSPLAYNGLT